MSINELAPGIVVFSDVIDGYDTLIAEIEDAVNQGVINWTAAYVLQGDGKSGVDTETRNTQTIPVSYNENPQENYSSPLSSFDSILSKTFYDSFTPLEIEYRNHYNIEIYKHEVYSILKYGVGQKFNNHIDNHRN
jgi:hypothetical protein